MPISLLRLTDFRNLASAELHPSTQGFNLITGDNGSGKTSLLEAIHYLSLGRSFRTATAARLIRHEQEKFSLFSQILNDAQLLIPLGMERERNGKSRIRFEEKETASTTELASYLPIRLINSQSHHLFESGPVFRRKYLDWGLFYQSQAFLHCWKQFERALKQRNAALKEKHPKPEIDLWTNELLKYGTEFDRFRTNYAQELSPMVAELAKQLLNVSNLTISYQSGWGDSAEYANALADSYFEDLRFGFTQFGPHRADFDVKMSGKSVKHFLSRGQQKLLICAMILAQGALLIKEENAGINRGLIYLVDDLPSELDSQSKRKLLTLLSQQEAQIFITAIEQDDICSQIEKTDVPLKLFHVEHSRVELREVVSRETLYGTS